MLNGRHDRLIDVLTVQMLPKNPGFSHDVQLSNNIPILPTSRMKGGEGEIWIRDEPDHGNIDGSIVQSFAQKPNFYYDVQHRKNAYDGAHTQDENGARTEVVIEAIPDHGNLATIDNRSTYIYHEIQTQRAWEYTECLERTEEDCVH